MNKKWRYVCGVLVGVACAFFGIKGERERTAARAEAAAPAVAKADADVTPSRAAAKAADRKAPETRADGASESGVAGDEALAPAERALLARLPANALRASLRRAGPEARKRVLEKMVRRGVPREDYGSLRMTGDGALYYVCDFPTPAARSGVADKIGGRAIAEAKRDGSPTAAAAPVPISSPPVRHSRPGAKNVLFLDFGGMTITGTAWNSQTGAAKSYAAQPYDVDGNPSTFSDAEQTTIIQVWERVAEDFAPFDVDVTTQKPATFTRTTGRALITRNLDKSGVKMPDSDAGGVAFLDVFGESDYATRWSPALAYYTAWYDASDIAEAVSHELGHNLGLSHDGLTDGTEYYAGHGYGDTFWAPIMGLAYERNITQWSKGDYYLANNTQDQLAILASHLSYRTSTVGRTTATATALTFVEGEASQTGILFGAGEVYRFTAAAGTMRFSVATYRAASGTNGGNADIKLELLDANGHVIATADPPEDTNASLSYAAAAGDYYVRLTSAGTGDPMGSYPALGYTAYGSIGQYTLTGSIPKRPRITSATTVSVGVGQRFSYAIAATEVVSSYNASGLPAGVSFDATAGVISGRIDTKGVFTIALGATNPVGTGTATLTLTVIAAAPGLTTPTGLQVVAPGGSLVLRPTVFSLDGTPTYQWKHNGRLVQGATGSTLALDHATRADSGYYQVYATNSIGTSSATIFVKVAPTHSEVVGWGNASLPPAPADLTTAVDIVAPSQIIALKSDGTVVGWGYNGSGQAAPPEGLSTVVAIAAGPRHSLALKSDGTVVAWGSNDLYQTMVPADLSDVVAIAGGSEYSLALKGDGTVVGWGYYGLGLAALPEGLTDVVQIAAGESTSLALKADGTLVAWGYTAGGALLPPADLSGVTAIASGRRHFLALKSDGTVAAWGSVSPEVIAIPPGLSQVVAIAATQDYSMAIKADDTLVGWGSNGSSRPNIPAGLKGVFAAAVNTNFGVALRDVAGDVVPAIETQPVSQTIVEKNGVTFSVVATGGGAFHVTYQWRKDGQAIAGATQSTLLLPEATPADAGDYDVVVTNHVGTTTSEPATLTVIPLPAITNRSPLRQQLRTGDTLRLAVTAAVTGEASYQWYHDGRPIAGADSATYEHPTVTPDDAGAYWVRVTDSVGTRFGAPFFAVWHRWPTAVVGWGDNTNAQTSSIPADLNTAVALAAGYSHVLALKSDGTVTAWGANNYHQTDVPAGLSDVVAVAAGYDHSLALTAEGTVVAWGSNSEGETLGMPVGLTHVAAIAAGGWSSVAIKTDGTVVRWGSQWASEANVVAAAVSTYSIVVLKADGTVVNFGSYMPPTDLAGVKAVAAGGYHTLALKADGTVVAWGYNDNGQTDVPVGLTDVTAVAGGQDFSLALKADGSVVGWGHDNVGQLSVPAGLSHVFAIAVGGGTSYALVPASNFPGIYFGSLASGGEWGLQVHADGTGTFVARMTARGSLVVAPVRVADDGTFSGAGAEMNPATPAGGASVTVTGQILPTGAVSGQLADLDESFTGALDEPTGPANPAADTYTARELGIGQDSLYLMVGPSGKALMARVTSTQVDGAEGIMGADGRWVATMADGSALTAAVTPAQKSVRLTVKRPGAETTSDFAGLADRVAVTTHLVNLSVRSPAGSGDQTLIMGFVIAGAGIRTMLLRGIGPSLEPLGVTDALADPRLTLFHYDAVTQTSAQIGNNDDWGGGSYLAQNFTRLGAFSLPALSKDAALLQSLSGGPYTVHVTSGGGVPGVALVECYDADATRDMRLVNVSARTEAGVGSKILIAGFVLDGNAPKRLLIRGMGPALVKLGVAAEEVLADPKLVLFKYESDTRPNVKVAENDDWGGTQDLKDTRQAVGAQPFDSDDSKDAALAITLVPGIYTAQVSGADGGTGVALVEVYEVP
jgi:alpha-tubulin suppressor-like RCC1 family protein